jgi:predicted transcriptional regulator of viral defense system
MLGMASARVPNGVLCLLSALRFHRLTTQNPSEVWLAIGRKDRAPVVPDLPPRVVRLSGEARTAGIETSLVYGVKVRVYGAAKTVPDCCKYRNKIGTDVAVETLQECWRSRRASADELRRYAEVCRVKNGVKRLVENCVKKDVRNRAFYV